MKTLRSWLVVVAVTTLSCGSDSPVKPGTACVVNSDCNNPLSCSFGTCHSACQESRDCPTGQRCVSAGPVMGAGDAGTSTVNVCQLAVEKTCVQNSDCKAPLVCARDLQCRNQCREDRDCATKSQKCIENVCADPDEFDATTMKLKDPPKPTDEGDNAGALAEFKRAYDLVPNKIVLFNIGMVYAAMNRPVEAVDALDQLLADPAALDADRAGRARHTREEQGHRVARLTVVTSAPAAIEIDGLEVGRTPLAQPLRVGGGAHVVAALALGHLPARKEVTIAGETSTELKLDLSPSESQMAHLTVKTSAPGIELVIDGQSVARTPVPASLTVAPGKHVVEARRRGYQTGRQEITLGDGASGELSFDMAEAADAAPPDMGRLVLTASESEPLVTVDGHPRGVYKQSLPLPAGPHTLRVDRGGFEPVVRTIEIAAGGENTVRVTLPPTPETRLEFVTHARTTRTWAWVSLVAGVAAAAAGGVITLQGQHGLDSANKKLSAVNATFAMGQPCESKGAGDHVKCGADFDAADKKVKDQTLHRNLGLAAAGLGIASAVVGTYLLLTGDDPHRYDHPDSQLALRPVGWATAGSGGVAVAGRF